MQLHDQCRLAVGEILDQRHPPQRPFFVEVGHRLTAGLGEHVGPARSGHAEPAHVIPEVEVRIDDHPRGLQVERPLDDLRAQHRGKPGGAFEAIAQLVPVRAALEHQQADNG